MLYSFALPEGFFAQDRQISLGPMAGFEQDLVLFSKPLLVKPHRQVRGPVPGLRFVGVAKNVPQDIVSRSARFSFETSRLGASYTFP
jgi:hypothetical protein